MPRALRGLRARRCAATPTSRTPPGCAPAATRRWRASSSARWGDYARALERLSRPRGGPARSACAPRAVDLLGHARGPAAAGHRRGRAGAGADRRGRPPARFGRSAGAAASGCRSAPTPRGSQRALADAGVSAVCVELTGRFGLGAARAPAPARERVGRGARADRPRHDLAGVERRRLPGERRLPRLPPPHGPPPQPVEQRRRRLRPRTSARARARARRRLRRADDRAPARRRRAACREAGWRCAPWTPSCSATGGMRASPGSRRSSRSARGRGSSWCAWTTRWNGTSRPAGSLRRGRRPTSGRRAAGGRTATCRPGRARRSPRWRSRRARPSSRCSAPARARAPRRCASCSRCRPATGRSWSPAASPRPTRASASRATARALARALAERSGDRDRAALRNLAVDADAHGAAGGR